MAKALSTCKQLPAMRVHLPERCRVPAGLRWHGVSVPDARRNGGQGLCLCEARRAVVRFVFPFGFVP